MVHGAEMRSMNGTLVYVGTMGPKGKGIYAFRVKTESIPNVPEIVTLEPLGLAAETANASFITVDAKRSLVFAVNETDTFEGKPAGGVSSFTIDSASGKLKLINQASSRGTGPCHLALDKTGRHLLVANYAGGSVAVLPVTADGRLGEATAFIQHTGKSVHPTRQTGPHAHCVTLDASNRFVFVCDLGLDEVLVYRFDAEKGTLTPNDPPFVKVKAGSGPRHIVFGRGEKFAYLISEINSTLTTFAYDAKTAALKELQTVSTVPEYFDGPNTAAELQVDPTGKYLFASNRGHNSVVLFDVDADKGILTYVEDESTAGKKPRHFELDRSGKYLIWANQDSDSIQACRLDTANGRLKPAGDAATVPSPTCVRFVE
jgi:6-phosphogluconolactonase